MGCIDSGTENVCFLQTKRQNMFCWGKKKYKNNAIIYLKITYKDKKQCQPSGEVADGLDAQILKGLDSKSGSLRPTGGFLIGKLPNVWSPQW